MMHMTLYWGKKVTILIDSWKTDSWTSYVLSLLACLVVAAFYQNEGEDDALVVDNNSCACA
ncbi:Copper transporter 5 [Glycine soja]|uniref:Copper transport protein n=1 Tax=Glycine soja TaxID=3848 RepID=A0A0B2QK70_GLYSO|nr:Copper transporter 5 [Glycine soja]